MFEIQQRDKLCWWREKATTGASSWSCKFRWFLSLYLEWQVSGGKFVRFFLFVWLIRCRRRWQGSRQRRRWCWNREHWWRGVTGEKKMAKVEKTWEKLKFSSCLVMVHWVWRATERENSKRLNMNLDKVA